MCTVLSLLPQPDVERGNSIEMFDEVELLTQLLQHYCIAWGSKGNVHPVSDLNFCLNVICFALQEIRVFVTVLYDHTASRAALVFLAISNSVIFIQVEMGKIP